MQDIDVHYERQGMRYLFSDEYNIFLQGMVHYKKQFLP